MLKLMRGQRIIGIDPGSLIAGYAIIEAKCDHAILPQHFYVRRLGVIRSSNSQSKPAFLATLFSALTEIMTTFQPRFTAIERAFVGQNAHSALRLGEARGALMAAANNHCEGVIELAVAQIKATISGNGQASKELIAECLSRLVEFDATGLPHDATDALACALSLATNPDLGSDTPGPRRRKAASLGAVARHHLAKH